MILKYSESIEFFILIIQKNQAQIKTKGYNSNGKTLCIWYLIDEVQVIGKLKQRVKKEPFGAESDLGQGKVST